MRFVTLDTLSHSVTMSYRMTNLCVSQPTTQQMKKWLHTTNVKNMLAQHYKIST